jgi:hypothetical protein
MAQMTKALKKQIIEDLETVITCTNDLWKLRIAFDFAIDNLKHSLIEADILKNSMEAEAEQEIEVKV